MTDQFDSSRFEPPREGSMPSPSPTGPTSPAGPQGWSAGTPDNPYDDRGERFTFDAAAIRPDGALPADPGSRGGRRRLATMGLGAAAAAAIVLGGGYVAYDQVLGGGGPQPESAFPANAIAFAKVDLDPSGGQKVDALRFARKFPKAPDDVAKDDADLRKVLFEQLQEDGQFEGIDYASDVAPWLGNRFGFAMVPGASGEEPVALLALAVSDAAKAEAGLAKLGSSQSDTHCSVGEAFALCGEDAEQVDAALKAGQQSALADSEAFAEDVDSLGEDGIVSFWADLGRFKDVMPASEIAGADASVFDDQLTGRFFGALRFDGPTLELVGRGTGMAESGVSGDANGVAALPADTVAAFGLSGGRDYIERMWAQLEKAELTDVFASMTEETGLSLPGDLQTLLGGSFTLAFGGMSAQEAPELAIVTDSAEAEVTTLVGKLEPFFGGPFSVKAGTGRTVIALEDDYAETVATGKGLGEEEAFKDAVPEADSASAVVYADIAGLVEQFGADMPEEERKVAEVFKSVGVSSVTKGTESEFLMRLTTN